MIGDFSIFKRFMFFFTKQLSKQAVMIVVPSSFFKKKAIELLEVSENKIYIYPSGGINCEQFYPVDKNIYKIEYGFKKDSFVVGMVSSIYRAKGWKVFLDAVIILKKEIANLKVLIAGYGIEEKELLSYIKENSLDDIVIYLGEKPHSELFKIYNALDVFIFPTMLEESLGLVGLEAMACGAPVVGSKIGGLTDYIKDDYNGYMFKVGDSFDLSVKIKKCIGNDILKNGALNTALEFESKKVTYKLKNKIKDLKC
jgi:glycosyltransferase involved in cell wall biosynthesis